MLLMLLSLLLAASCDLPVPEPEPVSCAPSMSPDMQPCDMSGGR